MTVEDNSYNGEWAIVELFGHTTLVGRIAEVERFGTKMLAIEPLFAGELLPAVFQGGAAIYRLTPCSEEVARKRQPQNLYQLPPTIAAILPPKLLEADEDPDFAEVIPPAPAPSEYYEYDDERPF